MQDKPFADVRILELGGYISLPDATSPLCALGAGVGQVKKAGDGDFHFGISIMETVSSVTIDVMSPHLDTGRDLSRQPQGRNVYLKTAPGEHIVILLSSRMRWLELVESERNGVSLVPSPWRCGGSYPVRGGMASGDGQYTGEIAAGVYCADACFEELLAAGVLFTDAEDE